MRIRIIIICAVMILSVMSGSLAFSAFSGTATTNVSATANFIGINDGVSVCAFWADNTELYVNSHVFKGDSNCLFNELCPPVEVIKNHTSYSGFINDNLNISNFSPGNAILFCIQIYNPNDQILSVSNISFGHFSGNGLSFYNATSCNNQEAWFAVVNNTVSQCQNPGGYYGIIWENGNQVSPGCTLTIGFFIFLSQTSGNNYQESSFTLPLIITMTEQ